MKTILIILSPLLILAGHACTVWAVISFIIYIEKDVPFEWMSVWFTVSAYITALLFGIVGDVSMVSSKPRVSTSKFRSMLNKVR